MMYVSKPCKKCLVTYRRRCKICTSLNKNTQKLSFSRRCQHIHIALHGQFCIINNGFTSLTTTQEYYMCGSVWINFTVRPFAFHQGGFLHLRLGPGGGRLERATAAGACNSAYWTKSLFGLQDLEAHKPQIPRKKKSSIKAVSRLLLTRQSGNFRIFKNVGKGLRESRWHSGICFYCCYSSVSGLTCSDPSQDRCGELSRWLFPEP